MESEKEFLIASQNLGFYGVIKLQAEQTVGKKTMVDVRIQSNKCTKG